MLRIGDAEITRVEESILEEDPSLFAGLDEDVIALNRDWLVPDFFDEQKRCLFTMIHSWVLRFRGKTILIDTAGGDDKDRPLSPRFHMKKTGFLERMKAAGVEPQDVDMVVLTHLHVDHVGWNTTLRDGRWLPTFPNAVHVVSAGELETRDPARGGAARPEATWAIYRDSVQPVLDAGLARIVEGTEELMPGLDLIPLPGHAPGMMGLRLRDGGKEALFVTDALHQPIQLRYPHWSSRYCENPVQATETRLKILRHAADTDAHILPAHFIKPYCARVRVDGEAYAFLPPDTVP
jgi:glyoxylase-like metal-dependent hydrolase (beta-lactamase superfamily II)